LDGKKGGEKMVNMRAKREAKNMSQQQLADAVGISRQAISNIELGTAKPDVKHAIIIGRVLEFNWVLFYDDED
jgi:putative transcriptional regulator